MAVTSSASSKLDQSTCKKEGEIKGPNKSKQKETKSQNESNKDASSTGKRKKCPGIRVVHGRIYDSQIGKTCHQCRQKTKDFAAECRNHRNNKPCPIKYCHKCLLNRYGEKAEAVALQDWSCPKCRGICNCSLCMKQRGHQPTGVLVHTAKANGYSSVSDMLQVNGLTGFNHQKTVADKLVSPRKRTAFELESVIIVPRKQGKENAFDGKIEPNLHLLPSVPNPGYNMPKKFKLEQCREKHNDCANDHLDGNASMTRETRKMRERQKEKSSNKDSVSSLKDINSPGSERKRKIVAEEELKGTHEGNIVRICALESALELNDKKLKPRKQEKSRTCDGGDKIVLVKDTSSRRLHISDGTLNREENCKFAVNPQETKLCKEKVLPENSMESFRMETRKEEEDNSSYKIAHNQSFQNNDIHADIHLPQGTEFTVVEGIKLTPEDVGKALQFLEFCAVFRKILEVKKGQPECILKEMIDGGGSSRRGKYSVTVQFQIRLISLIRKERGLGSSILSPTYGKNSWVHALKECISESESVSKSLPPSLLDKEDVGYENLNSSEKLMILNILCDEVLGTARIRNWIDDQISEHAEKAKEQKEKVLAAKDKEKQLKQKIQNEIARAIIEKNGAPLSISEHGALISQIKCEAAKARTELLESKGMLTKKQTSDAVRTEPIYLGSNGHVYWRLNFFSNRSDILVQEVGTGCAPPSDGRWFSFDDDEKEVIEKHINIIRGRRQRTRKGFTSTTIPEH